MLQLGIMSRGGICLPVTPARSNPHRSQFLRFDTQIFRNVATSGAGAPYEVGAPLREILDPPLSTEEDHNAMD